jgi:hypothetical protein
MTKDSGDPVALSLVGVTQGYGSVTVVDDVSLNVHDGECPSGWGKTTYEERAHSSRPPRPRRTNIAAISPCVSNKYWSCHRT